MTDPDVNSVDTEKPIPMSRKLELWREAAKANPFFGITLLGALVIFLLDQATKIWIVKVVRLPELRNIDLGPLLDFSYVQNRGASFGMLAGGMASRVILSLFALTIVGVLISWLATIGRRLAAIGIAFIIGGALGNVVDRVLYGYVIDFIDFSALYFPWVFNVADISINIGLACLIVDAFLDYKSTTKKD